MDKRESDAREVLGLEIRREADAGRVGPAMMLCGQTEEVVIRAMLAFADTRPAADLEAVKEACAKIAERVDIPMNTANTARKYIATAIRSLDLSAISGTGEG